MARRRKSLTRPLGIRRYEKVFFLSVEGRKTEDNYFSIVKNFNSRIDINCLPKKDKSSPKAVLGKMKSYLRKNGLKETDEAWLIVDVDNWKEEHLQELYDWSKKKSNYGLAVSNPLFDYWLLLHFEDGKKAVSARICKDRLKQFLPDHKKYLDIKDFSKENIIRAVKRAKRQDVPPCQDWPRKRGTTVYRLIEKILDR